GVFEPFEKHGYPIPADGYHNNFKLRFRTIGALATTDEWFFDNIYVGPAPNDVAAANYGDPKLTQISNTQPSLLSAIDLSAGFLNLGAENTGDLNVAVTDAGGATVYSDAWTGATIPAFSPAAATFLPWDASGAADGDYTINYYTSNFNDTDPSNDTLSTGFNIGTTMAYDKGVQSTSGTFSSTARSWFGINYTLADDDVLNGVTILVSASALATDSFAVELWTVVNDTPNTPIASIAEGAYSDLGALPALVTFAIDPGLQLTAGTYSIVFDMKNTASFPCGIDYTALGGANVPRTFWGKLETTTWLAFEDVGAGDWTAIIRAELGSSGPTPVALPFMESFEDTTLTIPDGWTQFDADGGDEVPGADWRISPNGQSFPPLDGAGEIFNNFQAANPSGLIDEWLFTPQFGPYQSGMELSFNLIHIDAVWADSVMVLVSTTDNDPGSFTMIDYINCPIDWTEYSYNLGDYGVNDGDNFYIAFRYYIVDGGSFGNQSNLFSMDLVKIDFPSGPSASKLLLSEIVVTPTEGEFVEIFNPGTDPVDLSNYYLTDATFAGDGTYYYKIVEGGGGGGAFGDFHARFPAGATIGGGEYQTVAMNGASFATAYGVQPTYELFDTDAGIPDMLEAFAGSINGQGGLTNSDEVVILYYWDGMSDLVQDVDYLLYNSGSPVANNELVDKTGVSIDGPDPGTDSTMYLPDTPDSLQRSAVSHDGGFSVHRIDFSEGTQTTSGGNGVTGADETSENLDATFTNNSLPSPNAAWMPVSGPGSPPGNVSATGGSSSVQLTWDAPIDGVELLYDDNTGEGNLSIGATAEGDLAVRFTPNVYPSTLLSIKVWFSATADPAAMTSGNYTVWDGTSAGPGTSLATGSHPINRGGFETVDVS
ncbi:MAG: choice-of-anchor J domain-containing protein, partial [Calditrichaeota bacterium]|nr:choice-of-anchor J domain-containing protein [Calditrichota bacterium]